MRKTISLILAVMMLLGAFSITAFAETPKNQTDITAIVPNKAMSYEMVIPAATTLTEEAHENVLLGSDGKVSIANVENGTEKVNVSYTVDLTNGTLTDGTNTIDATYKYKQGEGEFAAIDNTTKVTVYANKTVTDSFVNVTADDTQWDAAPAGTYNASVTFNFVKEDVKTVGAADAFVTGAQYRITITNDFASKDEIITFEKTADGFTFVSAFYGDEDKTAEFSACTSSSTGNTILASNPTFYNLTIDTSINTYTFSYDIMPFSFKTFEVKPAGATEFTEVTLSEAAPH